MLRQREWSFFRFLIHIVKKVILFPFCSDLSQDTCHDSVWSSSSLDTIHPLNESEHCGSSQGMMLILCIFSHRCHQMKGQPGRPHLRAGKSWGESGVREDKGSGRRTGLGSGGPGPGTMDSQLSPCTYSDLIPFRYNEELDQKVFECSASRALLHMPPLQPMRPGQDGKTSLQGLLHAVVLFPRPDAWVLQKWFLGSQHACNHAGEDECGELCFSCSSHPIPPAVFQLGLIETFTHTLLKAGSKQD